VRSTAPRVVDSRSASVREAASIPRVHTPQQGDICCKERSSSFVALVPRGVSRQSCRFEKPLLSRQNASPLTHAHLICHSLQLYTASAANIKIIYRYGPSVSVLTQRPCSRSRRQRRLQESDTSPSAGLHTGFQARQRIHLQVGAHCPASVAG